MRDSRKFQCAASHAPICNFPVSKPLPGFLVSTQSHKGFSIRASSGVWLMANSGRLVQTRLMALTASGSDMAPGSKKMPKSIILRGTECGREVLVCDLGRVTLRRKQVPDILHHVTRRDDWTQRTKQSNYKTPPRP